MSRAVGGMARGMWQEAGAALAGIGRRSPFAPWRLFCKTMVGYEAGDTLSVLRSGRHTRGTIYKMKWIRDCSKGLIAIESA